MLIQVIFMLYVWLYTLLTFFGNMVVIELVNGFPCGSNTNDFRSR